MPELSQGTTDLMAALGGAVVVGVVVAAAMRIARQRSKR
jgi:hypothetical protein